MGFPYSQVTKEVQWALQEWYKANLSLSVLRLAGSWLGEWTPETDIDSAMAVGGVL